MDLNKAVKDLKSRWILTSRGQPTIEVDLITAQGTFTSSCPSGASTGQNEAEVLLDNGIRFNGKGVSKSIKQIQSIIRPNLRNAIQINDQYAIDKYLISLDGTSNLSKIGANAILPVSLSFCKAGAHFQALKLYEYVSRLSGHRPKMPIPQFNVLNGGMHSGNKMSVQEVMIAFQHHTIKDNLHSACVFYESLKELIREKYGSIYISVGDEGGFAPPISELREGIDLVIRAASMCNETNYALAIDVAANSFYSDGKYNFENKQIDGVELCDEYLNLLDSYPELYSIEDPFSEADIESWKMLYNKASKRINIVADDLTVTNPEIISGLIGENVFNTLLVKPNQIGTVSRAIDAAKIAVDNGLKVMISHRSGETVDSFISDFAVGLGAEYFKAGAPCRGERVEKYNQLLRIEETLQNDM